MKRHRIKTIAAALLAAALLAGCGGQPQSTPASGGQPEAAGGQPTAAGQAGGPMTPVRTQTLFWAAAPEGAYVTENSPTGLVILYVDYAARTAAPLCGQAGCAHDGEGCTAWLPKGRYDLFYWQDRLYILDQTRVDTLWEVQPDGQNRRKLLEVKDSQIIVGNILATGRQLYFQIMETQDGQTREFLCRFELDSGEMTMLHDCTGRDSWLQGGWDNWLLLETTDTADPSIPNDMAHLEEYAAAKADRTHSLYRVSTEGEREAEPLFTWPEGTTTVDVFGSTAYILNTQEGTLTVRDLAAGGEQTIQDDRLRSAAPPFSLYLPAADGAILPIETDSEKHITIWYLYHDGQLTASRYQYLGGGALNDPRNRIMAETDGYYLVQRNFDAPDYALVPKADYWADSDGATDIPIQTRIPG